MKIWGVLNILSILISVAGMFLVVNSSSGYSLREEMFGFALLFSFGNFALGWRLLRGWTNYKEKKQSDILDDL